MSTCFVTITITCNYLCLLFKAAVKTSRFKPHAMKELLQWRLGGEPVCDASRLELAESWVFPAKKGQCWEPQGPTPLEDNFAGASAAIANLEALRLHLLMAVRNLS